MELNRLVAGKVLLKEPMDKHTSFGIGGPADFLVEVGNLEELRAVIKLARKVGESIFILGKGTNLLVRDEGIRALVIKLTGDFKKIVMERERIWAGAGVGLPQLVEMAARCGLGGLEFATGIPGTVGGAVVMNAGTKEGSISDLLFKIVVMDAKGRVRVYGKQDFNFDYRKSNLPQGSIILEVELHPAKKARSLILKSMDKFMRRRRETQPLSQPSAGCIFKNPSGTSAGSLIERAGLKGVQIGSAQVSSLHANFIINRGGATAKDVLALIEKIESTVWEKMRIGLEREIVIVGGPVG